MYLANLHKHKRCKLSVNQLSIDGQTTLKDSVIGSTSDDNGTNITTTINKIIDTAAESVEGGGITKLYCTDGTVKLNDGEEASTDTVKISAVGGGSLPVADRDRLGGIYYWRAVASSCEPGGPDGSWTAGTNWYKGWSSVTEYKNDGGIDIVNTTTNDVDIQDANRLPFSFESTHPTGNKAAFGSLIEWGRDFHVQLYLGQIHTSTISIEDAYQTAKNNLERTASCYDVYAPELLRYMNEGLTISKNDLLNIKDLVPKIYYCAHKVWDRDRDMYTDIYEIPIEKCTITGFEPTKAGIHKVKINYLGDKSIYNICYWNPKPIPITFHMKVME